MRSPLLLAALLCATLVPCVAATDGVPTGWHLSGTQPQNYRTGIDGAGTAFLVSTLDTNAIGFGTLMQSIRADEYRGKRVRFSATVRSENVSDWAGLWMRVDNGTKIIAFDNMENRPIHGTTIWNTYSVVLDVPPDATSISFGALVTSIGGIWLRNAQFGPVGLDARTTGMQLPLTTRPKEPMEPVNLDFRQ